MSKPPKKTQSSETKRRIRRRETRQQYEDYVPITNFPTTSKGFYNMGIHACDMIGKRFGIRGADLWPVVGEVYGKTPGALSAAARRVQQQLDSDDSYDDLLVVKEDVRRNIVKEVLESYWG